MKAYIHVNNSTHQKIHCEAMEAGFRKHGVQYVEGQRASIPKPEQKCDFVVCWGVRAVRPIMKELKARGVRLLVMERGYLPDRFTYCSLGWGDLNNRAKFPACADEGQRFNALWPGLIKPWRTGGDYVLICGQVPGDAALYNVNFDDWSQKVSYELRDRQQRVVFRPHPFLVRQGRSFKVPIGARVSKAENLEQDLEGANLCVTYNSNSGVESVLFGTPTVTMDKGAMAWDVTTHDLESDPIRPDRQAWAHRLSWCNWTLAEIESGAAWERLRTVA